MDNSPVGMNEIVRAAICAVAPTGWPRVQQHSHVVMISKMELTNRNVRYDFNELTELVSFSMDQNEEPVAPEAPAVELEEAA